MKDKYLEKLMSLPEQFKQAAYRQQWPRAKYIYDTAIRVAEFIDAPENIRKQLFGDKQDDNNVVEAMFPEELVNKAYDYCTIKLYQDYSHESYRRFGQPPQYYPQPRYPVPGYKKQ